MADAMGGCADVCRLTSSERCLLLVILLDLNVIVCGGVQLLYAYVQGASHMHYFFNRQRQPSRGRCHKSRQQHSQREFEVRERCLAAEEGKGGLIVP